LTIPRRGIVPAQGCRSPWAGYNPPSGNALRLVGSTHPTDSGRCPKPLGFDIVNHKRANRWIGDSTLTGESRVANPRIGFCRQLSIMLSEMA
jgi:hypothetical protein